MRLSSISTILVWYIVKTYLVWFIGITTTIISVIFLADFVDMLRRVANVEGITFSIAAQLVALRLPYFAQELIPIMALFASMGALWALTRKQELIVARAAGVSVWQFLFPIILTAIALGVVFVTLYNPIASKLYFSYLHLEHKYFGKNNDLISIAGKGTVWIKHEDHSGYIIAKGQPTGDSTKILQNAIVLHFDSRDNLLERFDAEQIIFESGRIRILSSWHSKATTPPIFVDKSELFYHVSVSDVASAIQTADSISLWELPDYIKYLKQSKLPYRDHELRFHHLLSLPILLAVMIFLSAVFSLRLPRKGGTGTLIASGAAITLIIFFFSDVMKAISLNGTLPVFLGVWGPIAIVFCFSLAVLLKTEDG